MGYYKNEDCAEWDRPSPWPPIKSPFLGMAKRSAMRHWSEMLFDQLPELRPAISRGDGEAMCFVRGEWRQVHLYTPGLDGAEPTISIEGLFRGGALEALQLLREETEFQVIQKIFEWTRSRETDRVERLALMNWEMANRTWKQPVDDRVPLANPWAGLTVEDLLPKDDELDGEYDG